MFDKFREECGLMGVWGNPEASNLAYLGLYAQQHRGQEGAGVLAFSENNFAVHRGMGLVSDVFKKFDFTKLPGDRAIGHVRYTTAGGNLLSNVQPLFSEVSIGRVGVAHNGNLINVDLLKKELIEDGAIFTSTSDTEVFLHLLAKSPKSVPTVESIIAALKQVRGAYSLLFLFEDRMFAVRDPHGVRPLCLAKLGDGIIVASETCAFDLVGAEYIRDIEPGELVEISGKNTIKSFFPFGTQQRPAPCIFEYVYFARPDSLVFGRSVYGIRKKMGEQLAKEHPVVADVVVPVPDSGMTAALGFSVASGIPLELGLIRNHYVGRTFIEPKQSIRDFGVKLKLNANPEVLKGKSVVVIDDSIVRGTTSKKLISLIRQAGAKEIHLRISAPPTTDPCYYGIDTPSKEELIASHMNLEEIRNYVEVDSIGYLSLEGLYAAVNSERGKFCDACFSGEYPLGTPVQFAKKQKQLL